MSSSKSPIIFSILLTAVFISGLASSSYNLGIYRNDRASDAYQISAGFTAAFSTLSVVSLLILIVLVSSYASSPEFSGYGPGPAY